jgi:NAD(P)-dependent dehydrogenase (short-subunit alcohol dehydrogenase family)
LKVVTVTTDDSLAVRVSGHGPGRFHGRCVLVAGAGSGIGAATAVRLADEGASVVVGDINGENAEKVAAGIVTHGGQAIAVAFDIVDEESVDQLVSKSVATFGRLDAVHVNVADLSRQTAGRDTDVLTVPLDVFDRTISVNLRGHLIMTKRVLPEFLAAGKGSIAYTASAGAFIGGSSRSAYGMSKAGLLALSRQVAATWGREGIRSNVVSPGLILTQHVLEADSEGAMQRQFLDIVPSTRLGQPEDIAAAVAFLLSDDAGFVNGQVISVDGGLTMR